MAVCGGSKEGEISVCQTVQLLSRDVLHNLDMIPKPTNARQCVEVYGTHTHTHTPNTAHMFRPLIWPSSGRCITKDRYIEILHKFLN